MLVHQEYCVVFLDLRHAFTVHILHVGVAAVAFFVDLLGKEGLVVKYIVYLLQI